MSEFNIKNIFGFDIQEKLYIASLKKNKVFEFQPNCIKVFNDNVTVHGLTYGLYGKWGTPTEYSLKNLDKRVVFAKKKLAKEWLERKKVQNETNN